MLAIKFLISYLPCSDSMCYVLGIKISDKCTTEELIKIIDAVNPENIPGRVTIIVRMGAEKLRANLPGLIRAVQREGKELDYGPDLKWYMRLHIVGYRFYTVKPFDSSRIDYTLIHSSVP